jgi:uncharacterized metal-binding protein
LARLQLAIAAACGAAIAAVDNFAAGGEVSPIVTVALLLGASFAVAASGNRHRWIGVLLVWVWLPMAHVVKHGLGLPDTIHPNTLTSIFLLGVFSLSVTMVGAGCGVFVRRVITSELGGRVGGID